MESANFQLSRYMRSRHGSCFEGKGLYFVLAGYQRYKYSVKMIHLFWMSQNKMSWRIVLSLRMLDFYFLITCFFIDLYFLILIFNSIVFIVDAIGKPLLVFLCLCWMLLSAIKLQWPRHELLGSTLLTSFKWWLRHLSLVLISASAVPHHCQELQWL